MNFSTQNTIKLRFHSNKTFSLNLENSSKIDFCVACCIMLTQILLLFYIYQSRVIIGRSQYWPANWHWILEQSLSLPHFNFKMHFSYNMSDLSFSSSCQSKLLDKTKTSWNINRGELWLNINPNPACSFH